MSLPRGQVSRVEFFHGPSCPIPKWHTIPWKHLPPPKKNHFPPQAAFDQQSSLLSSLFVCLFITAPEGILHGFIESVLKLVPRIPRNWLWSLLSQLCNLSSPWVPSSLSLSNDELGVLLHPNYVFVSGSLLPSSPSIDPPPLPKYFLCFQFLFKEKHILPGLE